MGTDRLNQLLFISVLLFSAGCVASSKAPDTKVLEARSKLKDYALVTCLIAIDPDSELAEDLKLSKRSLSFMGNGEYTIVQNEETFETRTDPYAEASSVLIDEAAQSLGYMKNGKTSRSFGCLKAYQSKRFNHFIAGQDEYIEY
ncbi:hypothetical protein [Enterovibrio norvegicus]|uniref:hypothetical protein n=1 Tax=Enterovibrio norvegicus TaxID=188144 RepID=UPI0024B102CD|nr:hypothetical protein [Enterovibrio norvegicus]